MTPAADVFALLMGYSYRTQESYRRSMIARWLSGRFCDPVTRLEAP